MYSTLTNRVRRMNKYVGMHWREKQLKKIMPRRNRISLKYQQRIVQAFEDVSEDYLTVR